MPDVAMPRLSDSMEEGTILKWLKSDGDEVARGEELVEIETDKANMTYEADQDGVLAIVAQEGDTLAVGETIARIGEGAEAGGGEDEDGEAGQVTEAEADEPEADEGDAEPQEVESGEAEQQEAEPEAADAEAEEPQEGEPQAAEADADEEPQSGGPGAEAPDGGGAGAPAHAASDGGGNGDGGGRVKASPVARRMARERGLELATLQGTGPGGRIVKADVEAAADGGAAAEAETTDGAAEAEAPAQPEPEPEASAETEPEPAAEEQPADTEEAPPPAVATEEQSGRGQVSHHDLTRLQQTVARRMAESKATAPEFVLHADVDMEAAVELRKQLKAAAGDDPAPSYNDFVIKAAALALVDFPRANGAYRDGRFELYSRVNVGVAVAGQDALLVPTVFDADRKSLGSIARESRALAERARAGVITPPELSAGTFTVSNLGMFAITSFTAVINPPQAAILAVGAMNPLPVVRDGEVTVRHMLALTLTCDHRILYGADAAGFLSRIRERLENPLSLAL